MKKNQKCLLTPITFSHKNGYKSIWLYRCKCGKEKLIRKDAVDSGHSKSCGCLQRAFAKSGEAHKGHGLSKTRFWRIWSDMKRRIDHKHRKDYFRYGGRGITYDNKWKRFEQFRDDMYLSYLEHLKLHGEKNTTIDRIDVNGDYTKLNCRWATMKEQCNNTRSNRFVSYKGKNLTYTQWEELLNLKSGTIWRKIHYKEKISKILEKYNG